MKTFDQDYWVIRNFKPTLKCAFNVHQKSASQALNLDELKILPVIFIKMKLHINIINCLIIYKVSLVSLFCWYQGLDTDIFNKKMKKNLKFQDVESINSTFDDSFLNFQTCYHNFSIKPENILLLFTDPTPCCCILLSYTLLITQH